MLFLISKPFISRLSIAILLSAYPGLSWATDEISQFTADQLLAEAKNTYSKGDWLRAAYLYEKFIEDYGKAPEVQSLLMAVRYDLAIAHLKAKNYARAHDCILAALANSPPVSDNQKRMLTFWLGICGIQLQQYDEARQTLTTFIKFFPTGSTNNTYSNHSLANEIYEAHLLIATTFILQENFIAAADYLANQKWPDEVHERALLLHLYALLHLGDIDKALELVKSEYSGLKSLTHLIAFQSLILQLGTAFLEKNDPRSAIFCLQRVWPLQQSLNHQKQKLVQLESQLRSLDRQPNSHPYDKLVLNQTIADIQKEMEHFQKIENFDSSLQLQLATAYQTMGRYRECALIIEKMLSTMTPNAILEPAAVKLVECWMQIERWSKAYEAAQIFITKFPQSKATPQIYYLQGIAAQKEGLYGNALNAFDAISHKFIMSEFAPRAHFMRGFTLLLAERNSDAILAFGTFLERYDKHELAEAAYYWRAMAYSLDSQFNTARSLFDEYLIKFPNGQFVGAACAGKAYAAHQLMDFSTSISEHKAFLDQYPHHEQASEARILLGDAYMNEGEMENGIAVMKQINPKDTRFFEEGWFKIGKALRLMKDYDGLINHMRQFCEEQPRSLRIPEALYQIGWVMRQQEKPESAQQLYWNAIAQYGSDASMHSVDELFPALQRLYRDNPDFYLSKLRTLATYEQSQILKMRYQWAQALALKKFDPGTANQILMEASEKISFPEINPMLLADFADAFYQTEHFDKAEHIYRELLKWHPRAPQVDRALATLGLIECQRGNQKAALDYFERFDRQTTESPLLGKVQLAKAKLEKDQGLTDVARASLEKLLANKSVAGEEKAEALFELGELYMHEGKPQLAVPYYQRVYIVYGRWTTWVAKAYLRSGEAFELLNDHAAARKSYEELLTKDELVALPEAKEAQNRLDRFRMATKS